MRMNIFLIRSDWEENVLVFFPSAEREREKRKRRILIGAPSFSSTNEHFHLSFCDEKRKDFPERRVFLFCPKIRLKWKEFFFPLQEDINKWRVVKAHLNEWTVPFVEKDLINNWWRFSSWNVRWRRRKARRQCRGRGTFRDNISCVRSFVWVASTADIRFSSVMEWWSVVDLLAAMCETSLMKKKTERREN